MQMNNRQRKCIACGKNNRVYGSLHCGQERCIDLVFDMSKSTVAAIRHDEAMEALREVGSGRMYVHFTERK